MENDKPCPHNNVTWEPVDIQYLADGDASIEQDGKCQDCKALVYQMYEPQGVKTSGEDAER